ncbi:hypothetical protein AAF712_015530 [Marasmius tenuissimus]|uniref:Uncharacterized protein n=1 Tax=Marasmius tenuissimus TaxID=585030 RepID=A0ABR2Z958_9AGAR
MDNADLANQVLRVDWSDTNSCSYSNKTSEWTFQPDTTGSDPGAWTQTINATMSFKFNGTRVSVYGTNPPGGNWSRYDTAMGTYQIDGDQSVGFNIPGTKSRPDDQEGTAGRINEHMFTTGLVSGGKEHEMIISYSGSQDTQSPQVLWINYFYVENDYKLVEPEKNPVEPKKRATSVGSIAGGVLAGVFGLVAIGGLLWLIRRRRRRRGGPRELHDGSWDDTPSNSVSEAWTGRPLQDSQSPTATVAAQSTSRKISTENFASMKRAQREVINGQSRQERDSGFRYGTPETAENSSGTATIPPAYTRE